MYANHSVNNHLFGSKQNITNPMF
uniref:Uncharacterized protein n=1 Tax=Anguilla anguilla TaxID=7936 RepID=A0A0E9TQQ9_ANGAN